MTIIKTGEENGLQIFDSQLINYDQKVLSPTTDKVDKMLDIVTPYLQPLIAYYKSITPKEREELKKKRGSGGPSDYWHILQQAVNSKFPDFNPPELEEWIFANKHVYNDETGKMLQRLSENVQADIRDRLKRYYGNCVIVCVVVIMRAKQILHF